MAPHPLIVPEIPEAARAKLRVAHRRCDGRVTQVVLYRARINAVIRQFVARRVAEHVRRDRKLETSRKGEARNQSAIPARRERRAALAYKHQRRGRLLLALKPPKCPHLAGAQWMSCRNAALTAAHVQNRGAEIDLVPSQTD